MQAIITKFIPATNTRGSRVKASCEAGSIIIGYNHDGHRENAHVEAFHALIAKLKWTVGYKHKKWVMGGTAVGFVFVCIHPDYVIQTREPKTK